MASVNPPSVMVSKGEQEYEVSTNRRSIEYASSLR